MQSTISQIEEFQKLDSNSAVKTKSNITTTTKKSFIYEFTTYLKDSNAYGNNYFARYFEWQGICREAWFFKKPLQNQDFLRNF